MKKSDIHKYALEWQEKTGLYYLPRGEMPTKIPTGCVLVHNKAARAIRSRPGISSFRAWFQEQNDGELIPSNKLVSCNVVGRACLTTDSDESGSNPPPSAVLLRASLDKTAA